MNRAAFAYKCQSPIYPECLWRLFDLVERILKRCDHDVSTGCFVYQGTLTEDGYPRIRLARKYKRGHRVVLALKEGVPELPRHVLARHSCDNRACCNAEHLSRGSNLENVRDKVERGRQSRVPNGGIKLSLERAEHIRALGSDGMHGSRETFRAMARRLGVSVRAIQRVRKGERWKGEKT